MMNDRRARRRSLTRLIPPIAFVALGLALVIGLSASGQSWATNGAACTLPSVVTLQGRPAPDHPSWAVPIVVTLHSPGNTTPLFTYNLTTDTDGTFCITHPLFATTVYDFRVKNRHTLRNLIRNVTLVPGNVTALNFKTLREGDANDNNYVEIVDFSILATTYDKHLGQPGFDSRADFNENTYIEIADFSLLATNYDRHGDFDETLAPAGPTVADDVTATLRLAPAYYIAPIDGTFTVDIRFDPQGRPFQGVATYMQFDPTVLEVVDENGAPATEITPGTALPLWWGNTVDNATGQISLSAGAFGETPNVPTTEFVVGTIRFRVKSVSMEPSPVSFIVQDDPPRTGVAYEGYYLPLDVANMSVRLPAVRLLWPAILRGYRNSTLPVK